MIYIYFILLDQAVVLFVITKFYQKKQYLILVD